MSSKILPVNIVTARSFFRVALRGTIAQPRFANERSVYGLDGDIDYVTGLLAHSTFFSFENPNGIWGFGLEPRSTMPEIREALTREMLAGKEAQEVADRILLHFGLLDAETVLSSDTRWFKSYGGELYARAARVHQPPLSDQLRSMAGNIVPWTEVLQNLRHRECILLGS